VAVVKQTETRALKNISSNRSTQFQRDVSGLYTPATLISTDLTEEDLMRQDDVQMSRKYLFCCCENMRAKTKLKEGNFILNERPVLSLSLYFSSSIFLFFPPLFMLNCLLKGKFLFH
jgi:hypothetical protein